MNEDDLTPEQAMKEFKRMVFHLKSEKSKFIDKAQAALAADNWACAQVHLQSADFFDTQLDVCTDVYDIFSRMLP